MLTVGHVKRYFSFIGVHWIAIDSTSLGGTMVAQTQGGAYGK